MARGLACCRPTWRRCAAIWWRWISAPPYPLDVWITYHADAKKSPRVRKAIEWLTDAFDPRRHPWFRDEFIHPRKFARAQKGGLAVMLRTSAPRQSQED